MTRTEYILQWLKWKDTYEIQAFRIFNKAVKQSFANLPINNLTYENYQFVIPLNIHHQPIIKAYNEVYTKIGLIHGKRVGKGINRGLKRFDNDLFSYTFHERIIEWVRVNCASRITSVNRTTADKIKRLVQESINKGLSVDEMHKYLHDKINLPNFTKYQSFRIARTETTTATNHAAMEAANISKVVLKKTWIATHDNRTRNGYNSHWDHLGMDGVEIPFENDFHFTSTSGEKNDIQYPCAPNSVAENGINCRCVVAFIPVRDENGFAISK